MQITPEILQLCAQQDRRTQESLYAYCYQFLMPTCMRYYKNAEDARSVYNTGFLKIIQHLGSVDLKTLQFHGWAKRIMVNCLIDEYRKQKTYHANLQFSEHERTLDLGHEKVTNTAEDNFGVNDILLLLDSIPVISAQVFSMYVIEGFSHKEIAELLEFSEGNSKWHLSTARKLLREKLEEKEIHHEKRVAI